MEMKVKIENLWNEGRKDEGDESEWLSMMKGKSHRGKIIVIATS